MGRSKQANKNDLGPHGTELETPAAPRAARYPGGKRASCAKPNWQATGDTKLKQLVIETYSAYEKRGLRATEGCEVPFVSTTNAVLLILEYVNNVALGPWIAYETAQGRRG